MAKKSMSEPKLPEHVYVYLESDGEGGFFPIATTDIKSIPEDVFVGTYHREKVYMKTVKHELR